MKWMLFGVMVALTLAKLAGAATNINECTKEQLIELPGIGDVKAGNIIEARPINSMEELDQVPGIGPVLLKELKPLITFDGANSDDKGEKKGKGKNKEEQQ